MKKKDLEQAYEMDTRLLRTALHVLAEDAFQAEVIDPEMLDLVIGQNKDYTTEEDWIQDRIDEAILRAMKQL